MIDNFAIGLTHALMLFAAWQLLRSARLDDERAPDVPPQRGWTKAKRDR